MSKPSPPACPEKSVKSHFHSGHILTNKTQTAPSSPFLELLWENMLETYILSLTSPPCSHLYEGTAVRVALGGGGGAASWDQEGGSKVRAREQRQGRNAGSDQLPIKKPSSSELSHIVFSKVLSASPSLFFPHLQNRILCCIFWAIDEIQLWKLKARAEKPSQVF